MTLRNDKNFMLRVLQLRFAAEVARSGADTFVAGSAIFGEDDYAEVIGAMRDQLATL